MLKILFKKILPSRLAVYAVLAAFAAGAWSSWWLATKVADARYAGHQEMVINRYIEKKAIGRVIEEKHSDQQEKLQETAKIVYKEIIKYVPSPSNDSNCNIPIGAVRLLNLARSGNSTRIDVPHTPGGVDEEGKSPSTISRADLIHSDAEIAIKYNELANRHNALVDWIESTHKE